VRFVLNVQFVTPGVTNWMTAAGIALIAGGLATLIGFRHALWGGGDDRGRERQRRAPRRKPAAPPRASRVPRGDVPQPRRARRRRGAVAAGVGADGRDGGLASLGLADEEPVEALAAVGEPLGEVLADEGDVRPDPDADRPVDGEPAGPDRSGPGMEPGSGRRLLRAAMAEVRSRADEAGPGHRGALAVDADDRVAPGYQGALAVDGDAGDRVAPGRRVGVRAAGSRETAEERTGVQPAIVVDLETPGAEDATKRDAPVPDVPEVHVAERRDTPVGDVTTAVPRTARDDAPPRRIARDGDRVDGWVRPDYHDQRDITGDYWTPVPDGEYDESGYGWPVPVERLPAVPPHPPASGFDLPPVNEPTAVVPQWPPARPSGRIEAPRAWRGADEEPRREGGKEDRRWAERDRQSPPRWPLEPADPEPRDGGGSRRRHAMTIERAEPADQPAWSRLGQRRRVSPVTEHIPAVADSTQMLPSVDGLVAEPAAAERPRSRPRPRPRPQPVDKSTVYVSKHAADPT
jgi:hypothetical protein